MGSSPLRLYVIYDERSALSRLVVDRLYEWFRTPTMAGPPLYVRTHPRELVGEGAAPVIPSHQTLEYFIPLIDAEIVGDPEWHAGLEALAGHCKVKRRSSIGGKRPGEKNTAPGPIFRDSVLFPVALHPCAVNCPEAISSRNMIRYQKPPWDGGEPDPVTGKLPAPPKEVLEEVENIIKHLTEAFTRDLSPRLFPKQGDAETQIFISYARADGTEIPKSVRSFVQSQTQCDVFLDENDIAFGQLFEATLNDSLKDRSSALIAVWGDQYPFRPWCRWELDRFTDGKELGAGASLKNVRFFPPVLVLDTQKGGAFSKVLPELAQATCLRHHPECDLKVFNILMRDVFFGLADTLAAMQRAREPRDPQKAEYFLNRLPASPYLAKLTNSGRRSKSEFIVYHPGSSIPVAERKLLKAQFPRIEFRSYRRAEIPDDLNRADLFGKHLWISASDSDGWLRQGYLPQHQREFFIRLLQPLVRRKVSLIYGGAPPKETLYQDSAEPEKRRINWTRVFLDLLTDEGNFEKEREGDPGVPTAAPKSRLYNPSPWPGCLKVTPADRAAWIPLASIVSALPKGEGLTLSEASPFTGLALMKDGNEQDWRHHYALAAESLTLMRRAIAMSLDCPISGKLDQQIKADYLLQIGGKMSHFSGILPGIFDEFLHAAENQVPIFLLGGFGGATEVLAELLIGDSEAKRAEARRSKNALGDLSRWLDPDTYAAMPDDSSIRSRHPGKTRYALTWEQLGDKVVKETFERFAKILDKAKSDGLETVLRNGLKRDENIDLLRVVDTNKASALIWKGIGRVSQPAFTETAP